MFVINVFFRFGVQTVDNVCISFVSWRKINMHFVYYTCFTVFSGIWVDSRE
jgi:hypothetical protein